MALAAATASEYFRQSGQQQVLYAYWRSVGDITRARLALNVANWYYQQLGIPYFYPSDLLDYIPQPTTPDEAVTIAASLPAPPDATAIAGAGSGSGSTSGFHSHYTSGSGFESAGQTIAEYCSYYPDDPICYGGGYNYQPVIGGDGGGGGGGGVVYVSNPVTIIVNQTGLTLADVSSRIAGALGSMSAAIATAVDSVLAAAIAGIQHAINAIGNELASVFHLLAQLAGKILNFLKGLLLDVVKGLVAAVRAIGTLLKDVIQHGLIPALQALQKARDFLIKIYERYLRKLLIVLQDIRKVLAILKVFNVGFATKLDNVLADIQAKISGPLLYLLSYTNGIANYINLILDARLFIQRPLFLASANANKGSTLNLLINAMNPTPDPARLAASQQATAIPTTAQTTHDFNQFLQTGHANMTLPVNFYVDVLRSDLGLDVT